MRSEFWHYKQDRIEHMLEVKFSGAHVAVCVECNVVRFSFVGPDRTRFARHSVFLSDSLSKGRQVEATL